MTLRQSALRWRRLVISHLARSRTDHKRASLYEQLTLVPRPILSSVQRPNFRSPIVNTDEFGFRLQYDAEGQQIDLATSANQYDSCQVLVGGSVAFGVGVSSDRATLANQLSTQDSPCINLGVRGATSSQELVAFILMSRYLPKVTKVNVVTGVNECILAAILAVPVYEAYGGAFLDAGAVQHCRRWGQAEALVASERLDRLLTRVVANCAIWQSLATSMGFDVVFALQPVAGWTCKPLASDESDRLSAERARIPAVPWIRDPARYRCLRTRYAAATELAAFTFVDSNHTFDCYSERDSLFVDTCHLNDLGTARLAGLIKDETRARN